MGSWVCESCGWCCTYFGIISIQPSDLVRWEAQGRGDLLSIPREGNLGWVFFESRGACIFLKEVGGKHVCSIYSTRPYVCRKWRCDGMKAPRLFRERCAGVKDRVTLANDVRRECAEEDVSGQEPGYRDRITP